MPITDKQHAHELIERLEQAQIPTAVRFLEFMLLDPVSRSIATAPVDEEPLTAEEEQARAGPTTGSRREAAVGFHTKRSWPSSG